MKYVFLFLLVGATGVLAYDYGHLKPEEQKYFKNPMFEGKNSIERIDANVREINNLHAEVAQLKGAVLQLQREVEELKKK